MRLKRTNEFSSDAVRIALTSELTRKEVASDLDVGLSTLKNGIRRPATLMLYPTRI